MKDCGNQKILKLSLNLRGGDGLLKKRVSSGKGKKKKTQEAAPQILILEGIVQGDRLMLESALAGYLMELKNSPLFDQPNISSKSFEFSGNNEVLRFKAQLNLI